MIIMSYDDQITTILNLQTQEIVKKFFKLGSLESANIFSRFVATLSGEDGKLTLIDLYSYKVILKMESLSSNPILRFSNNLKFLVVSCTYSKMVYLMPIKNRKLIKKFNFCEEVNFLAYHQNERYILIGSEYGILKIIDTLSGEVTKSLDYLEVRVSFYYFKEWQYIVAYSNYTKKIYLID